MYYFSHSTCALGLHTPVIFLTIIVLETCSVEIDYSLDAFLNSLLAYRFLSLSHVFIVYSFSYSSRASELHTQVNFSYDNTVPETCSVEIEHSLDVVLISISA